MKVETWLNRKIDTARLKSGEFDTEDIVHKKIGPEEIKKKIENAKGKFSQFIHGRNALSSKNHATFAITFDAMSDTLDLSRVPQDIAQSAMDNIVLSAPGITKTETGYIVSDPDLLYENFGPGSTKRKIVYFLSENSNKVYTAQEVAKELNLTPGAIVYIVNKLALEGEVIITEKSQGRGGKPTKFKITK